MNFLLFILFLPGGVVLALLERIGISLSYAPAEGNLCLGLIVAFCLTMAIYLSVGLLVWRCI